MINFDDFDIEEMKDDSKVVKDTRPDLYKFLTDNNMLDAWINNIKNDESRYSIDTHNDISYFLNNEPPNRYISGAFSWGHSDEGHRPWEILNNKWMIYKKLW